MEHLTGWLSTQNFLPHGHCYLWTPALLWSFVVAESVIVFSYYSIPLGLVWFVKQRKDLQFNWMFILFSAFIFACGTTHLIGIWTIWHPDYWLDAAVKIVTAAVSIVTAVLLWPLIPKALKLPSTKQLEEAVARLEEEIVRRNKAEAQLSLLNRSLERRTHQLETVNQELQAFAYSVSHDLRAPLRGIDGWSLALAEDYGDRLDETARGFLGRVRSEAQRMGGLIDDLLQLSRVSREDIRQEPVDMSSLAHTVAERLREAQPERRMEFDIAPNLAAQGDPRLLEIALTNLMDNAVKFTAPQAVARIEFGSRIEEDPETKARRKVFFVRDNGVGFDMARADKLFGAFQRLHKASEFPGTGIGLATVQRIVHRHEGRIWAESQAGQGAGFHFTLGEYP
ncbi:MAG: two-component sensor histidine kinase [Rhodocyclales bacterium]|nr:two-component sensor histidine kinase [Rhodocyclales bacterium]